MHSISRIDLNYSPACLANTETQSTTMVQLRKLSELCRDIANSDVMLRTLLSPVLCVPASSAPVPCVSLSDRTSEDDE